MADYYIKSIKGYGMKKDSQHLYPIVAILNTSENTIRKEAMKLIKAHPRSEFIIYMVESKNGKNCFMDRFWVHWDKESGKPILEFYLNEWKPGYKYDMSKPKSKNKEIRGFDPYMMLMTNGRVGYNDYKAKRK